MHAFANVSGVPIVLKHNTCCARPVLDVLLVLWLHDPVDPAVAVSRALSAHLCA